MRPRDDVSRNNLRQRQTKPYSEFELKNAEEWITNYTYSNFPCQEYLPVQPTQPTDGKSWRWYPWWSWKAIGDRATIQRRRWWWVRQYHCSLGIPSSGGRQITRPGRRVSHFLTFCESLHTVSMHNKYFLNLRNQLNFSLQLTSEVFDLSIYRNFIFSPIRRSHIWVLF